MSPDIRVQATHPRVAARAHDGKGRLTRRT